MKISDQIRKADDTFFEIFRDFLLFQFINPTNRESERDTFFERWAKRKKYNPTFEYNLLPPPLPKWKKQLEALDRESSPLGQAYEAIRADLVTMLLLTEARGTPEVTQHSIDLYGTPTPELVADAESILGDAPPPPPDASALGIKEVHARILERLRAERIEGWDVTEDPSCVTLAQIDWAHHKIRLQSGMIIADSMIRRIVDHLVEVHVYRTVNGERQPLKAFAVGFDGFLETEEGIALELEERRGLLDPAFKRRYSGRVLASSWAQTKSFYDVFTELLTYFPVEEAYSLTERSKRGLANTAMPGGFIQDHIFLSGKNKVSKLSPSQIRLLYTGKISIHHLPLIEMLLKEKIIFDPAFLPVEFHG